MLADSYLKTEPWPRVFTTVVGEDFAVSLIAQDGQLLFGPSPNQEDHLAASHNLQENQLPWQLQVRLREPGLLYAELARRQNLYLAMLVLVVALLIFGSYLTLRTVRRELEIARLKADFVSTVSHEFRSPLTSIRQLGEMLMRGRVPSEQRRQQYYELITISESERLARQVENVLDFSRMEEGRKQYHFGPLTAGKWLLGVAEEFQSEVAMQGVRVAATIPGKLPVSGKPTIRELAAGPERTGE